MMHSRTSLSHRLLAILLTACVSVCCCQTATLADGLTTGRLGGTPGDLTIGAAPSCCPVSPSPDTPDTPVAPDGPDGPDAPCAPASPDEHEETPDGCEICCIKGARLNSAPTTGPDLDATGVAMPIWSPTALALPRLARTCRAHGVDQTTIQVEPRTLLSQRCALII